MQFRLWIAATLLNSELVTYAACRLGGKLLDAFDQPWMVATMMAIMAPIAFVIGFKTAKAR